MGQPGWSLEKVFKQAAKNVKSETRGKQIPWISSSITGDFYFSRDGENSPAQVQTASAIQDMAGIMENNFWKGVQTDPSKEMYEAYLEEYPDGHYARIAKIKLNKLNKTSQPNEPLEEPLEEPVIQTGQVTIRSNVNNDQVTINGEPRGSTRLDLTLKAGHYELEVSKQGYETWERSLQVHSGSEQVVYAKLKKTKSPLRQSGEFEMVAIPSGSFMMGSNDGADDEKPVHRVSVQSFKMGKYEVTQGQWQAIMGSNPSHFKSCGSNCPVEKVSWDDVQRFIKKLNKKSGKRYRLPTEAEWEYACRSGGKSQKYCGGDSASAVGWHSENSGKTTHPIGQKQANGLGLYDMSGNVWEWTCSAYDNPYDGSEKRCGRDAEYYALRGGSWDNEPGGLRSAARFGNASDNCLLYFGFRLAQDP